MSAFDLCQTQGFEIENNFPQAIEISLLLGSVTPQSTEPKLSGERCSPFSTRLSTCECKVFFSTPHSISWQFHFSFVSGAHKRRENAYLQILVKDRGLMGQV